ncbi:MULTISPECIES: NAD(P)/FAD-dependent oxidoreductase [Paenibacillus]|uniref:FAD dependent oxidoreductase n=1 Tax=Paenibacillus lautus TaxID=1401 RepID=A0A1R1AZ86_PAELA|nr:FAD dependent oxidoreductase [Paenibacillus lautus]OME91395.1 FAD dependent oxidoreductase [Paenibacillus lautus]
MKTKGKALILGGGIAGLFTATVLSKHYDEVIVTDRDEFPAGPKNRAGTPQAYHPHRFLERGKMIVERWFPGITEELLQQGAHSRGLKSVKMTTRYGTLELPDEPNAGCSRPLLEWTLRSRVAKLPNVTLLPKLTAQQLLFDADKNAVTGVVFRDRSVKEPALLHMNADIVVDASGRGSKLADWLQNLGYAIPKAERLRISLGYSTRLYRVAEEIQAVWSTILNEGDPSLGIGTAVFNPIENQIAEVVLYRAGGASYPTTDHQLYDQEAQNLFGATIGDLLQQLEPVSSPRGYRIEECVRQHFEQMKDWPSGLLVLGDAFCSFDPIFGQGMTVAAIQADTLDQCLQSMQNGVLFEEGFERFALLKIQSAMEPAWWLSAATDLRWPGVTYEGHLSAQGFSFAQSLFDICQELAYGHNDMAVFEQYMMVTGLFASPQDLFNAEYITSLVNADPSGKGKAWLHQVLQETNLPLEELLARIIPVFNNEFLPSLMGLPD